MAYLHRIDTEELDDQVVVSQDAEAGLQIVVGVAPVNLAKDPDAVVNTPVVCATFAEAKEKLGFSSDYGNFTICQSMDASFKRFGVSPVIFINVLDPAKHMKAISPVTASVLNSQIKIEQTGILLSSVVVKNGDGALSVGADYTLDFDDNGYLEINFVNTADATSINVTANAIDPSVITEDDIIGGVNTETGAETGLEVIRQVYPKTGYVGGQLIVPKWSAHAKVAQVMETKIHDVNGVFNLTAIIDVDATKYTKYTSLSTVKSDMGLTDRDCWPVWPKIKIGSSVYDYSAVWAAHAAYTDVQNGDIPYKSPSNKDLGASAAVLADGTEVLLDYEQAQTVNSYGVVTAINDQGWKSFGNETAAFPADTATKDRFIAVRRMMNWYRNRFILTYKNKVDEPINRRLIESIVDAENQYLNGLAASGYIPSGCSIAFNEAENPIENILAGEIVFDCSIAFWTPAEHITEKIRFNPTLIQNALSEAA